MSIPKALLVILDGWGLADPSSGNAIKLAKTPNMDFFWSNYPHCRLKASGEAVGLPEGQMGNSEVGHLNLGAGRIVYQDLVRINLAIKDGSFFKNPVLLQAMETAKERGSTLHFMGLLSDGGVHSHIEHLFALLDMASKQGVKDVVIHAFLDGRDTPPNSAFHYLEALERKLKEIGLGKVGTIAGRYYAMDRDKRWERLQKAYEAIVEGIGPKATSASLALLNAYNQGITDEFVIPTVITDEEGKPVGLVKDQDVVIFFNFRPDRAREMVWALTQDNFSGFPRAKFPKVDLVCMTSYDDNLTLPVVFPPEILCQTLGEVISEHGFPQLRIAETEKYAHVTYFFSGGREEPFPKEERVLVPSPKVDTYDLKPEMSAPEVTQEVVKRIALGKFHLIVLNYANLDMVGHTGVLKAAQKAAEAVDSCLGTVWEASREAGYFMIVTADHGNAEEMIDPVSLVPFTAHTSNDVPFIIVNPKLKGRVLREEGILADVAPTLLELMGIEKPAAMTGLSLLF